MPEEFCRRKKIKPDTALRVTEVADGLYVTPVPEPSEKELREVIAAAACQGNAAKPAGEDEAAARTGGLVVASHESRVMSRV